MNTEPLSKLWKAIAGAICLFVISLGTSFGGTSGSVECPQKGMRIIVKGSQLSARKPGFEGLFSAYGAPNTNVRYRSAVMNETATYKEGPGATGKSRSVWKVTSILGFDFDGFRSSFRESWNSEEFDPGHNRTTVGKFKHTASERVHFSRPKDPNASWSNYGSATESETSSTSNSSGASTSSSGWSWSGSERRQQRGTNLWSPDFSLQGGTFSGRFSSQVSNTKNEIYKWSRPILSDGSWGEERSEGYYTLGSSFLATTYGRYYEFYWGQGSCPTPTSDTSRRETGRDLAGGSISGSITLGGPISQDEFFANSFSELGPYLEEEGTAFLRGNGVYLRMGSYYTGTQACSAAALRRSPGGDRFDQGLLTGFGNGGHFLLSDLDTNCDVQKTKYYWETDQTDTSPVLWAETFYGTTGPMAAQYQLCRVLCWSPGVVASGQLVRSPDYEIDPTRPETPHYIEPGMYQMRLLDFRIHVDGDNTTPEGYPNTSNGDLGGEEMAAQNSDDEENYPGVRVYENLLDDDSDGVVGYADGINKFGNGNENACGKFSPMLLRVPYPELLPHARFIFRYSSSDPGDMVREGNDLADPYILPEGKIVRLWKKDGDKAREPQSVHQNGDFIRSDQAYTPQELGWQQGDTMIRIYIEAVDTDTFDQSTPINVEYYPVGTSQPDIVGKERVKVRPYYVNEENRALDNSGL